MPTRPYCLGEFLNQSQKWATIGLSWRALLDKPPVRRRERTGEGFIFRHIYVHEHGTEHGFHTHILCHVPRYTAPAFCAWTQTILPQLARHPGTKESVVVRPARERTASGDVQRQWRWFAYLLKRLPPAVVCGDRLAPQHTYLPLRDI